jgi:hypothetical protein
MTDIKTIIDACTVAVMTEARRTVPIPAREVAAALHVVWPDWRLKTEDIEVIITQLAAKHSIPVLRTNDNP